MSPQPIQLSSFMLLHLRLLQLLGLCPVSLHLIDAQSQRRSPTSCNNRHLLCGAKFLVMWQYVHIINFMLFHAWIGINNESILYINDSFSQFNDVVKILSTFFAHYVALVETLLQRRHMQHFLQIYSKLHYSWATATFRAETRVYSRFIRKIVSFNIFAAIITAVYLAGASPVSLYFYAFFTPNAIVPYFRSLQILLYIELLKVELSQLNRRVDALVKFSLHRPETAALNSFTSWEQQICVELHGLMANYKDVHEMSTLLKRSMGLSIFCNYVKEYAMILAECYWSYWMIYNGERMFEYILIAPSALIIALLLTASRNCMRKSRFLAHSVHKLRHDIEDLRISTRIQNFSLQMLHQRIVMDAFGFFVLNCNMACDILGSIATYMIFFIQFMPKFKNL